MPPSLDVLESRRVELLRQVAQLGDLRSGSITHWNRYGRHPLSFHS